MTLMSFDSTKPFGKRTEICHNIPEAKTYEDIAKKIVGLLYIKEKGVPTTSDMAALGWYPDIHRIGWFKPLFKEGKDGKREYLGCTSYYLAEE